MTTPAPPGVTDDLPFGPDHTGCPLCGSDDYVTDEDETKRCEECGEEWI